MHLGRQNPRQNYTMGGTTLATTTSEKDLGVYVDTELTFEKHIETVVNQANRMLGLIRRSYTYLDSQSLLKLYTSLVRPTLEYANAAWTPILRRDQILLENVQRRATKLIPELRDRDYEDRLRILKLPSLYYRRARGDMIEAYKFTHSRARFCEYTVANAPKIVRMRLNKRPWSHYAIFFFFFFFFFFLGFPLLVEKKSLYPF